MSSVSRAVLNVISDSRRRQTTPRKDFDLCFFVEKIKICSNGRLYFSFESNVFSKYNINLNLKKNPTIKKKNTFSLCPFDSFNIDIISWKEWIIITIKIRVAAQEKYKNIYMKKKDKIILTKARKTKEFHKLKQIEILQQIWKLESA